MILYVTMYLILINLNRFNRVRLTLCIMLITCHLAVAYCLNTTNYFPMGWGNVPSGGGGGVKINISDSQTPVYANIISPISHSNWAAPIVPIQKISSGFCICGDFKVTGNKVCKLDSYLLPRIDDLYAKLSGVTVLNCCCCLPTPMTLASGGSPMFPLVVHQPASPSIWPAVQSLRRGLSTNPGATMWCVCGCS